LKNIYAKPFLKWAGGKTQLLPQIEKYYPQQLKDSKIKKYVEPFVGGGAVFFELIKRFDFNEIYLNDINEEIVLTYKVLQNNVSELIKELTRMEDEYLSKTFEDKEKMFYEIRTKFNQEKLVLNYSTYSPDWILHAAKVICLNKTCFNGLYRLNKKGEYNVPFGKFKNPTICDTKNLISANTVLQGVTLLNGDFEELTSIIDENTFVYLDPPYRPLSGTSSFNDYSKSTFNDDSQRRLAKWYSLLDSTNACLILSNSDPTNTQPDDDFFIRLYSDFNINTVYASRAINSKSDGRGEIRELLITNENRALSNEQDFDSRSA
jgi:DNA adenine methylase